jgi:poly(A) polymerase
VKGRDIVARGVAAGPEVARLLLAVEDRWIAEDFPDAGRVAVLLDETMAEVAREA